MFATYDINSPMHYNMFGSSDKSWDGTTLYAPNTEPNLLKIKKLQLPLHNGVISPPKLPPSAFTHISSPDAWKPVPSAVGTPSPIKSKKEEPFKLMSAVDQDELNSQGDAKSQEIESELTKQNLYKTEMCRNWKETGICRYGPKCQFAHGGDELRGVLRHPKYKTEICRQYHTTGACTYGKRCRFVHHASEMGPEGSTKDGEYSFQRQLAQLKFGDIMPSPNQSLFASPSNIPQEWFTEVEKLMGGLMLDAPSGLDRRIAEEEEKMSAPHQSHEFSKRDAKIYDNLTSEQDSYHESYDSTEDVASASCTETEEDSGEETSQEKRNKKKSRLSFFQKLHKEKRSARKSQKKNVK